MRAVWFGMLIWMTFPSVQSGQSSAFAPLAGMGLFGYLLVTLPFNFEASKVLRSLRSSLEATEPAASPH